VRDDLQPDEIELLNGSGRCPGCGHLDILHNLNCPENCLVGECECWAPTRYTIAANQIVDETAEELATPEALRPGETILREWRPRKRD
jgi:hypothetical protein